MISGSQPSSRTFIGYNFLLDNLTDEVRLVNANCWKKQRLLPMPIFDCGVGHFVRKQTVVDHIKTFSFTAGGAK